MPSAAYPAGTVMAGSPEMALRAQLLPGWARPTGRAVWRIVG